VAGETKAKKDALTFDAPDADQSGTIAKYHALLTGSASQGESCHMTTGSVLSSENPGHFIDDVTRCGNAGMRECENARMRSIYDIFSTAALDVRIPKSTVAIRD
jgi:hypothetical protein